MEKFSSLGNIELVIKLQLIYNLGLCSIGVNEQLESFQLQSLLGCIVGSEIIALNGSVTTIKVHGCNIQRETCSRFAVM